MSVVVVFCRCGYNPDTGYSLRYAVSSCPCCSVSKHEGRGECLGNKPRFWFKLVARLRRSRLAFLGQACGQSYRILLILSIFNGRVTSTPTVQNPLKISGTRVTVQNPWKTSGARATAILNGRPTKSSGRATLLLMPLYVLVIEYHLRRRRIQYSPSHVGPSWCGHVYSETSATSVIPH